MKFEEMSGAVSHVGCLSMGAAERGSLHEQSDVER